MNKSCGQQYTIERLLLAANYFDIIGSIYIYTYIPNKIIFGNNKIIMKNTRL